MIFIMNKMKKFYRDTKNSLVSINFPSLKFKWGANSIKLYLSFSHTLIFIQIHLGI
ncbi:hypothetical protein C1645_773450 [Glomus cerebriforme]|uniref:Uncharacterized protein n=1 Tax=Glomus cerebriforme TaxID=658196 RepID=A0A397SS59_9GLOM|nr:hypothetical protein C1645_773450 [Glomus cerebriforme]